MGLSPWMSTCVYLSLRAYYSQSCTCLLSLPDNNEPADFGKHGFPERPCADSSDYSVRRVVYISSGLRPECHEYLKGLLADLVTHFHVTHFADDEEFPGLFDTPEIYKVVNIA